MNMKKLREIPYKIGKIFIVSVAIALVTTAGVVFIVAPVLALFSFYQSAWWLLVGVAWFLFSISFLYQLSDFFV